MGKFISQLTFRVVDALMAGSEKVTSPDAYDKAAIAALLSQALLTASSFYIMARQLGGDTPLMAGIIYVEHYLHQQPCQSL